MVEQNNVDVEVQRLSEAYDAFRGMDRPAQIRALQWLAGRLESDAKQSQQQGNSEAEK
jgi:hypothetical protein